ncbi:translocation/assembly module TamB [Martelella mediterranea]|uniref:translocation/assembly module TamB domain-containing protein n=1 Tax=Martelella mediterranea TaxID=293089 RepID=UPI001E376483|nr:translocation/assembly module TamB domain-containing protein [Martelella mediterranea]MCD1635094.1 translocation/assembly module TamB [Martelella mediterranea]
MAVFFKRLFQVVASLLALVIVIVAAAVILIGYTDAGANFAVRQITKRIASPDFAVHVGRVSAPLTGNFTVDSVTVSDIKGPYATVEGIALDWSPMALFRGRFAAENLSARTVSLSRLPVPGKPAPEKTPSSGGFSLPIGIDIEKFDFPEIDIAEAVAGEAYPLSASGHVSAVTDRISTALDIEHRARAGTYVKADIDYAPDENLLDITAEVNEPEGGMVATLLKLPGTPALNIAIDGDGPLSDWKGRLTAALSGEKLGEIDIRHQLNDRDERTVTVTGQGEFAALTPPEFQSLVEGQTGIDVQATLYPGGRIAIGKGRVETGSFVLNASGAYDPKGENDLDVTLDGVNDGSVPFSMAMGDDGTLSLSLENASLSLHGAAESADLSASVTLSQLSLPQVSTSGVSLAANGKGFNLETRTGAFNAGLTVESLAFRDESLDRMIEAPLSLKTRVTLAKGSVKLDDIALESGSIGATANVDYDLGSQEATGHARLFVLADALPDAAAGLIDDMTRIESDFFLSTASGAVALSNLKVENGLLTAGGDVRVTGGTIDATLKATVAELGRLAPQVKGSTVLDATIGGDLTAPEIDATVKADSLDITGETLKDFVATIKGKADMSAPSGALTAKGSYAGAPLSLSANVTSNDGQIEIAGIDGAVGKNTLSGDIILNSKFQPAGGISFDFPDLKLLAGLAGQKAEGAISGRVELDNANDRLGLSIDARSDSITTNGVTARNLDADMTVADVAALKASGKITLGSVAVAGQTITDITLSASNQDTTTNFDLAARYDGQPVSLEAAVNRGDTLTVDLKRLEGSPMGLGLRLLEPGRITMANGTTNIESLRIGIGGGTVALSGSVGDRLNLTANINGVSAAIANQFVPSLGASGTISGTITAGGTTANPTADYNLRLDNGNLAQTSALGGQPFNVTTTGRYDGSQVTTDTTITNAQGINARATGSVGLTGNRPLNLSINGRLPMQIAAALAANSGFAISGNADVNMTVGGTLTSPSYSGGVDLAISALTDIRRGISLNDIGGRIALSGDRVQIDGITGRLAAGGTLTISGSVGLTGGFPASLKLVADNAVINDGRLLTTTANGTLTLEGPILTQPTLAGRLTLARTAIVIPDRLPASISQIDIVHQDASKAVLRQAEELSPPQASEARTTMALDLTISAPNAIFVRGRGVDAELGGNVRITGTTQNPVVSGGFDLIRGRLSILNRRLDFTQGRITFGGALIPMIDLRANTNAGATAITIALEGVANDPQVKLSSTPALPDDEILAQLLFNQSSSQLSALQIAQLADAVIQLTGGTDQSLFGSIRDVLGVDNLDLTTDSTGNTAVSVGKYLNSNTYLEIEQSRDTGTRASVNIDIGRNFILKGAAGSRGEASGGIFYEKEY